MTTVASCEPVVEHKTVQMTQAQVRRVNLDSVQRVRAEVQAIQSVRLAVEANPFWIVDCDAEEVASTFQKQVRWTLIDENTGVLPTSDGLGGSRVDFRAVYDGKWYLIVEHQNLHAEKVQYGVIHEMLSRALAYWTVVDKVLAQEPSRKGVKRSAKRIQRMLDWMSQDCWELRQVCHPDTFRGILAMVGGYVSKRTITDTLRHTFGLGKLKPQATWVQIPTFPHPVPMPVRDRLDTITDWTEYADSLDGTADAWAGRALCPVCNTVNTTRPFCVMCGALSKLTHTQIQMSDLSYLDWR